MLGWHSDLLDSRGWGSEHMPGNWSHSRSMRLRLGGRCTSPKAGLEAGVTLAMRETLSGPRPVEPASLSGASAITGRQ